MVDKAVDERTGMTEVILIQVTDPINIHSHNNLNVAQLPSHPQPTT